jgi:threonine aldolase
MKMFLSDNNSGVHQNILDAICKCNREHAYPYGDDEYSKNAEEKIKSILNSKPEVFFVTTGTAANVIAISSMINSYEGVICTDTAHINIDECGALEKLNGTKLIYTPHKNGKLDLAKVKPLLDSIGDEHHVQPKIISISQPTELGTVYTVNEIRTISEFAHKNGLFLHIDGARLANAAVSLNTSFEKMITETNVDILSFGGTKNGLMFGEAIVSFNKQASKKLKFIRKQNCQLMSKMRYLSAQFLAYLDNNLWYKNAENSNNMAKLLINRIQEIDEIKILYPVETNIIFMTMPKILSDELLKDYFFHIMNTETNMARIVTSFDTTEAEINQFADHIFETCRKLGIN